MLCRLLILPWSNVKLRPPGGLTPTDDSRFFIYSQIKEFGALVFAATMNVRQVVSILVSYVTGLLESYPVTATAGCRHA